MDKVQTLEAIIKQKDQEIARLRQFYNDALSTSQAKDAFVRWFATEYGLETLGRLPEEMKPGKTGFARHIGWIWKRLRRKS